MAPEDMQRQYYSLVILAILRVAMPLSWIRSSVPELELHNMNGAHHHIKCATIQDDSAMLEKDTVARRDARKLFFFVCRSQTHKTDANARRAAAVRSE